MNRVRSDSNLRVAFAGTPDFAATALRAIYEAGFTIEWVLTQPDRPAGRHLKLSTSPVKRFALDHGLQVLQPSSLSCAKTAGDALEPLRASGCDVMVVAAYGLLLPRSVLDIPRHGCINLHASLLPRWRGAAPIQRAIEAADTQTGITVMQMETGLDTGPIITQTPISISHRDNAASLHDKLASCAAEQIVLTLNQLEIHNTLTALPQPHEGVCYASKITPHEAFLDWRRSAQSLANQSRAFDPHPGCKAILENQQTVLKFFQAEALPETTLSLLPLNAPPNAQPYSRPLPGTILKASAEGLWIACGEGLLSVTVCQKSGGKRLPIREFLAGFPLSVGQRFVLPA